MFTKSIFRVTSLITACTVLFLASCDIAGIHSGGDTITEIRTVEDFHALDISVPGKVIVHIGTEYKVEVQCEESAMPYLKTEVENGSLHVYFSRNLSDVDHLVVTVTAPAFDAFDISGSTDVIAQDPMDGTSLDVDISGSGDLKMTDIAYDRIELEVSGSGDVLLKGQASQMIEFDVSGSGNLNTLNCPTPKADIKVSGSGEVKCHVEDVLKARVSGSGDVYYSGNPVLDVQISGSGTVKKI